MKKQILTVALGLFTIASFAQKNELKAAEKAIKKQDYASAVTAITSAESLIGSADAKTKSKFYFLKAQAYAGKKDYEMAGKTYKELFAFEKANRKRYTDKATPMFKALKTELNNKAFSLHSASNFKESSKAFYTLYKMDNKDTMFLSNSAQLALQAKEYDTASKLYTELIKVGYTGVIDTYEAVDKATNKKATFNSKQEYDLMLRSGKYKDGVIGKSPSKRGKIIKAFVSVLSQQKKYNEAIDFLQKARVEFPNDLDLLLSEAFLYNDLKQPKKFAALMKEATSKDPSNPNLYYNIGIVNYEEKNIEESVKYFSKAVELKPDFPKGNWMLANAMLLKDAVLVKKMNDLPPSDMKNYDKLEKERKDLYNKVLPVLIKADKAERTASSVRLLIGIYEQLEMSDKASALRTALKDIE